MPRGFLLGLINALNLEGAVVHVEVMCQALVQVVEYLR
jgi:hypothetical protein